MQAGTRASESSLAAERRLRKRMHAHGLAPCLMVPISPPPPSTEPFKGHAVQLAASMQPGELCCTGMRRPPVLPSLVRRTHLLALAARCPAQASWAGCVRLPAGVHRVKTLP